MTHPHRFAAIAGGGIGKQTLAEGLRVLEAAARLFGVALRVEPFDFASGGDQARHGQRMPSGCKR